MICQPPDVVDDESFSFRVLAPPHPTLVLFTSPGCLPCEVLARRLPGLVLELRDPIDLVYCPVEASPRAARAYRIARTPTLLLFIGGRPIASRVGLSPLPTLRSWVLDALGGREKPDLEGGDSVPLEGGVMSSTRILLRHLVSRTTALRACGVASVVAPVLLLVNHADLLLSRPSSLTVLRKLALNFLVPYAVSLYSSARAAAACIAAEPRGAS